MCPDPPGLLPVVVAAAEHAAPAPNTDALEWPTVPEVAPSSAQILVSDLLGGCLLTYPPLY